MSPSVARTVATAVPAIEWDAPEPLRKTYDRVPYPIDALPEVIRKAALEVQGYVQSPMAMVACSALSSLAVAVQSHFNVARDSVLNGPTSLYVLVLGDSGERKSSGEGYFNKPIDDYEEDQREQAKAPLAEYAAAIKIHKAQTGGLTDAIRKSARDGKPTTKQEGELSELESNAPERPRVVRLMLTDATPEALTKSLANEWPSAMIATDEGGVVLGGHAMNRDAVMRNLAQLNTLWDAKPLRVSRVTSDSYTVSGARLSMMIQVQPTTLKKFSEQNGELARGSGWFARFLFCYPESTQGKRPYEPPPESWTALNAFQDRLREVLYWHAELDSSGGLNPSMLVLSDEAQAEWIRLHNEIEAALADGGELADVRDVASKAADNIARVAALFEVASCEGKPAKVGIEAMSAAGRVVGWHLHEARRYLGELSATDEQRCAAALDKWLVSECNKTKAGETSRREVQHRGPSATRRNREKLNEALASLEEHGRVKLITVGQSTRILVNPALLESENGGSDEST